MKCESLYEGSKVKRHQQRMMELEHVEQIKQMSSSKKISQHSHNILLNKVNEQLAPFDDDQVLSIQSSIPLLHATHILQVIESIESAKQKLEQGELENSRLREEARFVYCLWKMIDEEEVQTREMKEIILMLNEKLPAELNRSLSEIYKNDDAVFEFVETWRALLQERQYYRSIEMIEKRRQATREKEQFDELASKNESNQIRDYFINSKEGVNRSSKMLLIDSTQNKQNSLKDKIHQNALVNRLYEVDKYKMREFQKKLEEEKRQRQMLQSCTFKPEITQDRLRSASANKRSTSINGYQKAVRRMKVAQQKTKIQKQKRDHKPIGENYEKLREMKPNPPSFLQRKKRQEKVQFVIEFDLGRHKIKAKIHESDQEEAIAGNLCKIYCLKQEYFQKICQIIKNERENYHIEQQHI